MARFNSCFAIATLGAGLAMLNFAIDEIANRIIEFPLGKPGCLDYEGNFEDFLQWKRGRA